MGRGQSGPVSTPLSSAPLGSRVAGVAVAHRGMDGGRKPETVWKVLLVYGLRMPGFGLLAMAFTRLKRAATAQQQQAARTVGVTGIIVVMGMTIVMTVLSGLLVLALPVSSAAF